MGTALQKRLMAGLGGIFMIAAIGSQTGCSVAPVQKDTEPRAQEKEKTAVQQVVRVKTPVRSFPLKSFCVQQANDALAREVGFSNADVMRNASALAHLNERNGLDPTIVKAIAGANRDTGADFYFMVTLATMESSLGVHDSPILNSSRARGPFQYLPASFMTLFNWFAAGYENGVYAHQAAKINFDENGDTSTEDPALKTQILELRSDPYVASYIKGMEIMKDEKPLLRAVLGREPDITDHAIAHVLGLDNDKTLIRAMRKTPKKAAADIFPVEAAAADNYRRFYKNKKKITVREFYDNMGIETKATMKTIKGKMAQELADYSCIQPISVVRPQPVLLFTPD